MMRKLCALVFAGAAAMPALDAVAHPLGNNSVNRQSALTVAPGEIELRYRMDLAEIPALLEAQSADRDGDGTASRAEWQAHSSRWAFDVLPHLFLRLDGTPLALTLRDHRFKVLPGEANLATLQLEAVYSAPLSGAATRARLEYSDRYRPERGGWKEIYIRPAAGAAIERASVPQADRSGGLTDFSLPLVASRPNELAASATIRFDPIASIAANGQATRSTPAHPAPDDARPPAQTSAWQQAGVFFMLGIHHIATGWDHIVFLLGLLLVSRSLMGLIKVVTAFTVAHSVTLALAATGLVVPPAAFVEPAIALSIAYVGLAGLLWRASPHASWVALLFGLVHGFGFAGALAATMADMPPGQGSWLVSLASFNLGIEAFQVLLVCAAVPLLRLAARVSWADFARRGASLAVLGAGITWFVARALPAVG